ncbi:uncharacterized protein TRUGW13939_06644 [Talaromyces rugulosus]|uniref:NADPH--cytochrome P450 reductase n=1 Tax=Talaromyces rugulosus TaxID=121627 RepID=A0A7H8QZI6_TALRU|nr:uncharacterized protein TRUGW13939_06644 [Talaromyces rugulosus]QKX59510.1 hypothetical protein TRUGW13939_06644 [Talaromyces rugulosus]
MSHLQLTSSLSWEMTLSKILRPAMPATLADYVTLAAIVGVTAWWLYENHLKASDPYHHLWFECPQQQGENNRPETRRVTNIAEYMDMVNKNIVIFWGSQSGTSEAFAHRLARELHSRYGQETLAADPSDFDATTISLLGKSRLAIFIISTYGEGEPTDNVMGLWNWVQNAASSSVQGLRYAAFGLGNSNYKNYNRAVDCLVEQLSRLGAEAVSPLEKGDDATNTTEEDFMVWKENLFKSLVRKVGLEERENTYEPVLLVQEDESLTDLHLGQPEEVTDSLRSVHNNSPVRILKVIETQKLFDSSDRQCHHLELDISKNPELIYKTGDHLGIWPSNPDSEVKRLLKMLGLEERRNNPIRITSIDLVTKVPVPTPTTIEAILRYYLEICGLVPRDILPSLATFAPTNSAKAYISNLGEDKEAYSSFMNGRYMNIGRLLEFVCPSGTWSSLPLSYLLDILPRMQPRYYSISSSSSVSPRRLSITVAVAGLPVQTENEVISGVTTNYLLCLSNSRGSGSSSKPLSYQLGGPSNMLGGDKIYAHIRRSKFKLPALGSSPLIMVAAGTGLAPFRGFLKERSKLMSIGRPVGSMILFFGCRNEEEYIYHKELQEMQSILGQKLVVVTAFSRSPGQPREYVQDCIVEHGNEVVQFLDQDARFYICGRASMALEARRVLVNLLVQKKGMSEAESDEWCKSLKRGNKWQEDVWG